MSILSELEPNKVFYYFEQLCNIPHGSGNTTAISNYLKDFAIAHKLRYIQDKTENIIIYKPATAGYENSAPVMLQGHMDMVCEKDKLSHIDFSKDGLELILDGDNITANGTTLGGDDGIAVAYALAILDSHDLPHPPLEAVFTVDEEIGMLGAAALDCSPISSRIMLNLDSEDEGHLLVSCAGGITATCHIPVNKISITGTLYKITVSGLLGGHSGVEIDKGRANANVILARVLFNLRKQVSYSLLSINGGLKDNAIPREAVAEIAITGGANKIQVTKSILNEMNDILKNEYSSTDPDINISGELMNQEAQSLSVSINDFVPNPPVITAFDRDTTKTIVAALFTLPYGVQKMSQDIPGLVETSLNPGILKTNDDEVTISYSVRSSVSSEKYELTDKMECLMTALGGTVTYTGDYPAWEYKKNSTLRELMIEIYKEQYGSEPVIEALHAGVECGIFSGKLPGLDAVSFGPDIKDIHTTSEALSVESVKRTWNYLLEILKRL